MSEVNIDSLITDLAFILILGAFVTLLFKWIKQPVVLGYIVAGFLASPNFTPLPSVANEANIEFWAQIGIIVLLFSLGLEFSFKKLVSTGSSAIVTALIIVIGMMATGFAIGRLLGFTTINSLFLGGMLSMSSTTIIIKALGDLGLSQKKFAMLVFAVLVVEDMFAVVMMVVLSSIAINDSVEGGEMLLSVSKLAFFLIIWFLVGIFVLPSFLNKSRKYLNNETLLIVSMGLCLGMSIFSVACGFSLALGAFVMGSILAGTSYAERIEKVTLPVKDLFGSVFFISVGMMVQPTVIVEYWPSILLLSAVVIVGMIVFGTFGMLVTGQSLKTALEAGFSLTQIGEFAFIIASLGMSLGVLEPTIYPIVVAVSVITTFTTPYFIKMSYPFYKFIERHLPERFKFLINRYTKDASGAPDKKAAWVGLIRQNLWRMVVYTIVLVAIIMVAQNFFLPWLERVIPNFYKTVGAAVTLLVMSPFLLALSLPARRNRDSVTSANNDVRLNSDKAGRKRRPDYIVPRVVLMIFRIVIVIGFIIYALSNVFNLAVGFSIGVALVLFVFLFQSRKLSRQMRNIEERFINNLNERDLRRSGKNNSIVSDLHLAYIHVGYDCPFVGERLGDSQIRIRYGVNISSITRGSTFIPVPTSNDRIFPGDIIGVIGTDTQIEALLPIIEGKNGGVETPGKTNADDYSMTNIVLSADSPIVGKTLASAGIRANYSTLVLAVERGGEFVENLGQFTFAPDDVLYVYAPKTMVERISSNSVHDVLQTVKP